MSSPDPESSQPHAAQQAPNLQPVRIRRAPRFVPIIGTGVLLGIVVGIALVAARPEGAGAEFSVNTLYGYLGTIGGMLGGLLAGLVAVLLDRRS